MNRPNDPSAATNIAQTPTEIGMENQRNAPLAAASVRSRIDPARVLMLGNAPGIESLTSLLLAAGHHVDSYPHISRLGMALLSAVPDLVCIIAGREEASAWGANLGAWLPYVPRIWCVPEGESRAGESAEVWATGAWFDVVPLVDHFHLVSSTTHAVDTGRLWRLGRIHRREQRGFGTDGLVSLSPLMKQLLLEMERLAPSMSTVHLMGEIGTGRSKVARWVHDRSPVGRGPFIAVDLANIPHYLQEIELAGQEAVNQGAPGQSGHMERAHGGTLYIREVSELTPACQVRLLRVIQERRTARLGSTEARGADFRLLCSSQTDLRDEVRRGRLREDLYGYLSSFELKVPPLRERRADLETLVEQFFTESIRAEAHLNISDGAMSVLQRYHFPGNVSQLRQLLEKAYEETKDSTIDVNHFPGWLRDQVPGSERPSVLPPMFRSAMTLDDLEQIAIKAALKRTRGNITHAMRQLGIGRTTLYRKLKKYNIRE